MPSVEIRECREDDYKEICRINRDVFGYEYPEEKTKQRLCEILNKGADKLFAACMEGKLVGYIHGSDYECTYCDSLKNIMAIAVDTARQEKGVGRLLLTRLEQWAADCGCAGVRLVSGLNREKAHGFYKHCGYALRKEQKNFMKLF